MLREVAGDVFKRRLRLDYEKAIHRGNKWSEESKLVKTSVEVLILLLSLSGL